MTECTKLEHAPDIPQEVLDKNKVTMEEVCEAICEIERLRIEDNNPNIIKFFNRIFKRKRGEE